MSKEERLLPKIDYYIDESDPDIVILRRQHGTFVAAFSARGATMEGILEAAKEDYWRLIEARGALKLRTPLFSRVLGREILGSSPPALCIAQVLHSRLSYVECRRFIAWHT